MCGPGSPCAGRADLPRMRPPTVRPFAADAGSPQARQQRLCILQLGRVEAFGKPAVDGCEKLAGAQQAGEADRATELEPAAALLSCDRQRSAKATLDFRPVGGWQPAEEFAAQAAELCV